MLCVPSSFSLHFICISSPYTFLNLYKTPHFLFLQVLFSIPVWWPHYHDLDIRLRFHQPWQDFHIRRAVLNSRVLQVVWSQQSQFAGVASVYVSSSMWAWSKNLHYWPKMEICRQSRWINKSMFTSSSESFELQGVEALRTGHLGQKPACLQSNGTWRSERWVYRSYVPPCVR